jgi:hypothetical protein
VNSIAYTGRRFWENHVYAFSLQALGESDTVTPLLFTLRESDEIAFRCGHGPLELGPGNVTGPCQGVDLAD